MSSSKEPLAKSLSDRYVVYPTACHGVAVQGGDNQPAWFVDQLDMQLLQLLLVRFGLELLAGCPGSACPAFLPSFMITLRLPTEALPTAGKDHRWACVARWKFASRHLPNESLEGVVGHPLDAFPSLRLSRTRIVPSRLVIHIE